MRTNRLGHAMLPRGELDFRLRTKRAATGAFPFKWQLGQDGVTDSLSQRTRRSTHIPKRRTVAFGGVSNYERFFICEYSSCGRVSIKKDPPQRARRTQR